MTCIKVTVFFFFFSYQYSCRYFFSHWSVTRREFKKFEVLLFFHRYFPSYFLLLWLLSVPQNVLGLSLLRPGALFLSAARATTAVKRTSDCLSVWLKWSYSLCLPHHDWDPLWRWEENEEERSRPCRCHDTGCGIIGRLIRFHHKALIACFRPDWLESSSYFTKDGLYTVWTSLITLQLGCAHVPVSTVKFGSRFLTFPFLESICVCGRFSMCWLIDIRRLAVIQELKIGFQWWQPKRFFYHYCYFLHSFTTSCTVVGHHPAVA